MGEVAIVGAAMTPFGERDEWLRALLNEAGADCLSDAGVPPDDVEHLYVSQMAGGELEGQTGVMNAVAHDLGLLPAYTARIDQTSSSGAAGVYEAWQSVESGASDMTLLVGGEKMTHATTERSTDVIASLTHPVEYSHGVTLPSFAGLVARRYLADHDAPRESLAKVAVKNHANGVDNPNAQFQRAVDVDTVMESPMVADPLRLYDFCPVTDGSSALLFCPEDVAREYTDDYVVVSGVAGATDTHVVHEREEPTRMAAAEIAGRKAFERAGLGPDDVDVAELHDMVSVLELLQLEALGFCDRGDGWRAVENEVTAIDGSLPVNPSGGLKAKGHPLGATGVAQVYEIYEQLLGDADGRQVDADVGLACNVGGFGNCVITSVLEVAR